MQELELTFLAKELPKDLKSCESKEMVDIYIPVGSAHPDLRIRKMGDKYEITRKRPIAEGDASNQLETTIQLDKDEYDTLSKVTGKKIEKTRYYFTENSINYEIDVFRGDFAGLVLIDVEFRSLEAKAAFTPPSWSLAEVTQEKFLAGGMLCGKKYPDIETELEKYGYKRLLL